ncbi:MAG: response regulator, partial [Bradymonadaceae bacterium]
MPSPRIRVLLIEDNPLHAQMIRGMLEDIAHPFFPVERVDTLAAGLSRAGKGGIDVIMLDLVLPDSQGLDTFFRLKSEVPEIPVVVMTSLDDMTLATRAVENGAQDYLLKNQVNSALLSRSLRYAVERARAHSGEW